MRRDAVKIQDAGLNDHQTVCCLLYDYLKRKQQGECCTYNTDVAASLCARAAVDEGRRGRSCDRVIIRRPHQYRVRCNCQCVSVGGTTRAAGCCVTGSAGENSAAAEDHDCYLPRHLVLPQNSNDVSTGRLRDKSNAVRERCSDCPALTDCVHEATPTAAAGDGSGDVVEPTFEYAAISKRSHRARERSLGRARHHASCTSRSAVGVPSAARERCGARLNPAERNMTVMSCNNDVTKLQGRAWRWAGGMTHFESNKSQLDGKCDSEMDRMCDVDSRSLMSQDSARRYDVQSTHCNTNLSDSGACVVDSGPDMPPSVRHSPDCHQNHRTGMQAFDEAMSKQVVSQRDLDSQSELLETLPVGSERCDTTVNITTSLHSIRPSTYPNYLSPSSTVIEDSSASHYRLSTCSRNSGKVMVPSQSAPHLSADQLGHGSQQLGQLAVVSAERDSLRQQLSDVSRHLQARLRQVHTLSTRLNEVRCQLAVGAEQPATMA